MQSARSIAAPYEAMKGNERKFVVKECRRKGRNAKAFDQRTIA